MWIKSHIGTIHVCHYPGLTNLKVYFVKFLFEVDRLFSYFTVGGGHGIHGRTQPKIAWGGAVRGSEGHPAADDDLASEKGHLLAKRAPARKNGTCSQKGHLLAKRAPARKKGTCSQKGHLLAKTAPARKKGTCSQKGHLLAKRAPARKKGPIL